MAPVIEALIQLVMAVVLFSFGWRSLLALLVAVGFSSSLIYFDRPGANNIWVLGSGVLLIYISGLRWEFRTRGRCWLLAHLHCVVAINGSGETGDQGSRALHAISSGGTSWNV